MDSNALKGFVSRIRTLDTDCPGLVLVLCVLGICVVLGVFASARHGPGDRHASSDSQAWLRYVEPEYRPLSEHEKRQRAVQMMYESEDEVLWLLDGGGE